MANILDAFGVPKLLNTVVTIEATLAQASIITDVVGDFINDEQQLWTVFTDNEAIDFDGIVELDYQSLSSVPNYPVELGSFGTYNKLTQPDTITLLAIKQGDHDAIYRLIETLTRIRKGIDIIGVSMPEKSYLSFTLIGFNYARRVDAGFTMFYAQLQIQEVRESASNEVNELSKPKDIGNIQPS